MPTKPKRFKLSKTTKARRRPDTRQSASARGYDRHHQRVRALQLRREPVCEAIGCNRLATDVDHITRISDGGKRFDPSNLQSLCHACHSRKTQAEGKRGDG